MNHFIIIRGPLGVGKTTISKKLAKILDAEYVSIDTVLSDNELDKVNESEGGIPVKNFIKGNKIVMPQIKDNLSNGKTVIIDGCFYHKEQIKHFINNLNASHFTFTLKAPVEVCIERDKGRERGYGEGAAMAVHCMVSKFDYGTVIDTDSKTADEVVQEIVGHLN
ncbi:ATP-binding protein [Patescibacteria group bacterium]|nr:ATP-binding protein [Patescibacteria group bacterium]MBU1683489.1 ATP-binding protein [Patescibacteria group bacterium]MBU1935059.1 ATP-binding protein [Patescibacteria group bacterium]